MNYSESLRQLPPESKIWIYVAERNLNEEETQRVDTLLQNFVTNWSAHDMPLRGAGEIIRKRILLIGIDQNFQAPSGCSIDKSFALVQTIQKETGVNFLNRLLIHTDTGSEIRSFTLNELQAAIETGELDASTPVINTLVQQLMEFRDRPLLPLHQSWAASRLHLENPVHPG